MRTRLCVPIVAAAAILLTGCAADPVVGGPPTEEPGATAGQGATSCAEVVEHRGHTYAGHGELARTPEVTGRVAPGMRVGCDDGNGVAPARRVEVEELAALPLGRGFILDGQVYVREDLAFPDEIRPWFRSPRCVGGPVELRGRWVAVTSPRQPRFDGDLRPPYRVTMWVDEGPEDLLGTRIDVRADQDTEPGLDRHDAAQALWEAGEMRALVRCEDGGFVAMALSTEP